MTMIRGATLLSLFLDLVIILLFLYFLISGYKNGFIISFVSLFSTIFSVIFSKISCGFVAEYIYAHFIKANLILKINDYIIAGNKNVGSILGFLPSFVFGAINEHKTLNDSINYIILSVGDKKAELITEVIAPIILSFLKPVIMILIFILTSIVLKIVRKGMAGILRVRFLRQFDGLLGMIAGCLKGIVGIIILSGIFGIILMMMDNSKSIKLENSINQTFVFKHVYRKNPFYSLLSEQ